MVSTTEQKMAQVVKNLPAMQETRVQSLGREALLQKGMATYSSILTWRIPRTEEPGYSPWGCKESDTIWLPNSKKYIRHTYMEQNNTLEE